MMPSKPDLTRVCKFNCCYGCETYTVPANISLRIYSKDNDKYRHVNIWQYLQLGLLVAASQIKTDFQSTIEVNYTIRKEAFACEENLLGQNSKKTLNNYVELYYSKEEQRKIFMSALETRIQIIYLNHHWRRWMAWKKKHLWALKPCVIRIIWHLVNLYLTVFSVILLTELMTFRSMEEY